MGLLPRPWRKSSPSYNSEGLKIKRNKKDWDPRKYIETEPHEQDHEMMRENLAGLKKSWMKWK